MDTGHMELNSPRILGSAISPRNMGTAVKDSPSVSPAMNRAMWKRTEVSARPIMIHEAKNGTEENRISLFRPRVSMTRPVTIAPRIAPSRGMIANQEPSVFSRRNL
ncbi:hypothetical protein GEV33_000829 [Tenebrio molitor]|uniref:Uncharacterized protein n=1 Tax=Tenebrio molitor TaxID=7067 RepID=A0A8J6LKK8_TENMO|nr:hypothetical protein GEV33_000829 [Tenebrio molitor]